MSVSLLAALDEQADRRPEARPVIEELRRYALEGGGFTTTPWKLAHEHPELRQAAEALLDALTPPLRREVKVVCNRCQGSVEDGETRCRRCDADLEGVDAVGETASYRREGEPSRSVDWLLLLHGMNTRGAWQEALSWRVARSYGRMVGVAIYKYGYVVSGVLLPWRHRKLIDELAERIRTLSQEARAAGFRSRPDVIAHSFGTWLLGHALRKNRDLELGRIVLTGSILRPDFDWNSLLAAGRVEAVINHRGTKDFWARIAHYLIPDSGPSGRYGFNGSFVLDRPQAGFTHSQFFEQDSASRDRRKQGLEMSFEQVWERFLQLPKAELSILAGTSPRAEWRPAPWPCRATLAPAAILLTLAALLALGLTALAAGLIVLPEVLRAAFP